MRGLWSLVSRLKISNGGVAGVEFALVLPETTLEGARRSIDRVRNRIATHAFMGLLADDRPILTDLHRGVWDLARRISMRLGYLPPALESTA